MAETDFIARKAIYDAVNDIGGCDATEEWAKGYDSAIDAVIMDIIEGMPAADVAPVRHGHWECNKSIVQCDVCGFGLFPDGYFFENGECTHANEQNFRLNFCPNCGAKMDGTQ